MTYMKDEKYVNPVDRRIESSVRRFAVVVFALGVFALGVLALGVLALGVLAVRHYYYILYSGQRASDPDLVVYRVDDARRLVVGRDAALLINTQEHVVLSLSPAFARRLGPVLLWPRDALLGVVLGDGVKGDVRDSYQFAAGRVDIRYGLGAAKQDLHVAL